MNKYWIFIVIAAFFFVGFAMGMIVQQGLTQGTLIKFGESLEGVTLNIDFNETLMVDRITENFMPLFEEDLQDVQFYNLTEGDKGIKCSCGIFSNNCTKACEEFINKQDGKNK